MDDLRAFVSRNGGRFYVFGSVAADRVRHDSDMDILIDMPASIESDAWRVAEKSGRKHGISVDILSTTYASEEFTRRVRSSSTEIAWAMPAGSM